MLVPCQRILRFAWVPPKMAETTALRQLHATRSHIRNVLDLDAHAVRAPTGRTTGGAATAAVAATVTATATCLTVTRPTSRVSRFAGR